MQAATTSAAVATRLFAALTSPAAGLHQLSFQHEPESNIQAPPPPQLRPAPAEVTRRQSGSTGPPGRSSSQSLRLVPPVQPARHMRNRARLSAGREACVRARACLRLEPRHLGAGEGVCFLRFSYFWASSPCQLISAANSTSLKALAPHCLDVGAGR